MNERLKFRHLRPDQIIIPEVRVTSIWSDEEYSDFTGSIKTEGIQQALKCIKEGDRYILIDGLHRLDEAKRNGLDKVPVVYKEGEYVDALVENLGSNRLRGKTPASDEVRLLKHLRDEFHLEPWQIAEKTGLSRTRIEQRLQIASAAPEVLSCLEFEQVSLGVAYHLSRLPNESGQIALLSRLLQATPPATVREVEGIVDSALEIQRQMIQEPASHDILIPLKTIACHLCGETYAASDMRGLNACATCHGLSRDYIQQLKKKRAADVTPQEALALRIATDEDLDGAREALEKIREGRG